MGDSDQLESPTSKPIFLAFMVIMATEIGDKTFLISAIMSMKNPRLVIFWATLSALAVMTVLSAYLGHVVPNLISKKYTQVLAGVLFLVFGFKMLKESKEMTGNETQEEMDEVNELLRKDETNEIDAMESGSQEKIAPSGAKNDSMKDAIQNLLHLIFSPVFIQTFTLTFLAEWGDRSQIATIALAGTADWVQVSIGSLIGHSICTGIAVIGGKLLAERISIKTVTLVGGALFILFAILAFYEASTIE